MGHSRHLGEMRSAEDSHDLAKRSRLTLVVVWLSAPVANVISKVSFLDEFLSFILEHNALLGGMADIFMILTIFVLIPF